MELLDYHYADEKVRAMAVEAVERLLTNDELDNFLLQLIQVLVCSLCSVLRLSNELYCNLSDPYFCS